MGRVQGQDTCTRPCVGSAPVKNWKVLKKLAPWYVSAREYMCPCACGTRRRRMGAIGFMGEVKARPIMRRVTEDVTPASPRAAAYLCSRNHVGRREIGGHEKCKVDVLWA